MPVVCRTNLKTEQIPPAARRTSLDLTTQAIGIHLRPKNVVRAKMTLAREGQGRCTFAAGGGIRSRRCFQGPDAFFPPQKMADRQEPPKNAENRADPVVAGATHAKRGGARTRPLALHPRSTPHPPRATRAGIMSTHTPKPARFCLVGATGAHPPQGPVGSAAPRGRCPQGPTPGAPRRPVRRPRNAARAPPGRRAK